MIVHWQRFLTAIALGLGLAAAGGIPSVQAQSAPVVLDNATGDCVTTGSPGNWTIMCGDINTADGQSVVVSPPVDTAYATGDSGARTEPVPEPAPVTEPAPAPETTTETLSTETTVATATDQDADNYDDSLEPDLGLDPSNADTDNDGVADGDELVLYSTQPLAWDTDGDGISDGEELFGIKTDPLIWDDLNATSGEPATAAPAPETTTAAPSTSSEMVSAPTSSTLDSDSDAIADADEVNIYGTDPTLTDTDGDSIIDGTELFSTNTDPLIWDTNGDGIGDGETMSAESAGTAEPANLS